jgi:hypothetical protein
MSFFFELLAEKNNTNKKKVYCTLYFWMGLYGGPGLFHFAAPVGIIKDQYTVIMDFG